MRANICMFLAAGMLSAPLDGAVTDGLPSETITIGVPVRRGMSRQDILKLMADKYRLVKIGTVGDTWIVESTAKSHASYGSVVFDNKGAVSEASKNLTGAGPPDAITLALVFRGAIDEVIKEGVHTCNIETSHYDSSEASTKSVTFICGGKSVSMTTTESVTHGVLGDTKQQYVDLQEQLLPASNILRIQ